MDGRFEYSKGADSISRIVGSAESQGVDGKHVTIIIKLHAIPTCLSNMACTLSLFWVVSQEIPENGGISDQTFYCGPVGAAFDYNEFILPYVGVAIMFFSVVYSRYGAAALLFLPFDYTLGVHDHIFPSFKKAHFFRRR